MNLKRRQLVKAVAAAMCASRMGEAHREPGRIGMPIAAEHSPAEIRRIAATLKE
jgi:hypothetical protein